MLSTKTKKIVSIIMIVMMLMLTLSNVCMAAKDKDTSDPVNLSGTASEMKGESSGATDDVKDMGNKILGFIQTAGVVVAVIIIAVIGVKYIMGSAEEKAEYKKVMIPYLVGAVLIAAAPFIAGAIFDFASNVGK